MEIVVLIMKKFIGVFDYTVILTYLSVVSAGIGLLSALSGNGHPYVGCFFLMFCGLCDAFDGKIARTKKNRTAMEKNFGIQIDSLHDILAFGVLPIGIGTAMIRQFPDIKEILTPAVERPKDTIICFILYAIMIFYLLAALIRLAYYNVTEEERQQSEDGVRKYYDGLPVTASCLIFPTVALFNYILKADITIVYFIVMLLTGILFITKIKVPKPRLKHIIIFICIGCAEFGLLSLIWHFN